MPGAQPALLRAQHSKPGAQPGPAASRGAESSGGSFLLEHNGVKRGKVMCAFSKREERSECEPYGGARGGIRTAAAVQQRGQAGFVSGNADQQLHRRARTEQLSLLTS